MGATVATGRPRSEFKATEQIERAEFVDPVADSAFNPEKLEKQIRKFYPDVTLFSRTSEKHEDRHQSASIVIQNLLKAVEDSEMKEAANQIIPDSRTKICYGQQNAIDVSEDNPLDHKTDEESPEIALQESGNKSPFYHSKRTSSMESETFEDNNAFHSLHELSRTEQQTQQYGESKKGGQSKNGANCFDASSNQRMAKEHLPSATPDGSTSSTDSHAQLEPCESIKTQ
ncbi:unnamed protein product, partial [Rotaria sp. Silwood1]